MRHIPDIDFRLVREGDAWTITGRAGPWAPIAVVLEGFARDEEATQPLARGEPAQGEGWSVQTAAEVTDDVRSAWWAYHDWTDEDEADEPLTFCRITAAGSSVVVSWMYLQDLVIDLQQHKNTWAEEQAFVALEDELCAWASALPIAEVSWASPDPSTTDRLRTLEATAAELDARAAGQKEEHEDQALAADRRAFLVELHGLGLLQRHDREPRRAALQGLGLPELVAYHDAAQSLLDYLESPQRRETLPKARSVPVLASPVSIDWFRLGPYIGGIVDTITWTAWGESEVFDRHRRTMDHAGFMIWKSGRFVESFVYRMDNERRAALLKVGRPVPGARATATRYELWSDPGPMLETAAVHVHEHSPSDPSVLPLVIALLGLRLRDEPDAAHAWYRLGLALLMLSQARGDQALRTTAAQATARALLLSPEHEAANHLWTALLHRPAPPTSADAFAGDPSQLRHPLGYGPRELLDTVVTLSPSLREEVLMALADNQARDGELTNLAVRWTLRTSPQQKARAGSAVSPFLRRYVLKRIGNCPTPHSFEPELRTLATSPEAAELSPHLPMALQALGIDLEAPPPPTPRRPWWKFW